MAEFSGGWVLGAIGGVVVGAIVAWNWVKQPEALHKLLLKVRLVKE